MSTFIKVVYGPMFIGVIFNVLLYGVMLTQTYMYFNMYKDDRSWIKSFVLILFLCDTVNTGFDIAFLYDPLINNFGNVEPLTRASWMFITDPVITAIIAFLVQLFFAWRVNVLTSNRWIVTAILICAVAQLLGGIGTSIGVTIVRDFGELRKFQAVGIVWLVAAALGDVLITAALVWHLRNHKTGMTFTDDLIDKIIRLTVQTGLITAVFAMINLALYLAMPTGYDMIFNLPLAKLYTNSLMSTLNSQRIWKAASDRPGSESLGYSGQRSRLNVNVLREGSGRKSTRVTDRIVIGVESHQMGDFEDVVYPPSSTPSDSLIPDQKTITEAV
ncbi:hypothetical protein GSI_06881 [Ganoderma sinense ZZ0214-1]|uniref:DUF6534 domain-containing protein n=1 Tax=Ganoderma sinense ZZ0214-1 TaxID=1077348 RepID=A0A2G8SAD2_9APHY|nr:hypothetical protein GSI_06881 [Ganoderma sinense ZZ0214-1]